MKHHAMRILAGITLATGALAAVPALATPAAADPIQVSCPEIPSVDCEAEAILSIGQDKLADTGGQVEVESGPIADHIEWHLEMG